jgi:hypothetical protein
MEHQHLPFRKMVEPLHLDYTGDGLPVVNTVASFAQPNKMVGRLFYKCPLVPLPVKAYFQLDGVVLAVDGGAAPSGLYGGRSPGRQHRRILRPDSSGTAG